MDFPFFGAEKAAVVLDIGSRFTRCGFAGESVPRRIFSTSLIDQNGKKLSLFSFLATHSESRSEWLEAIENLLHEIYFLYLQCNPRERRGIVCENLLSPAIFRESLAHILLEKYQVLAVTFVHTPVVSLVPLLKTTALVVDIGFSETRVVPVYGGVGITSAMTSSQISARAILQSLVPQITLPGDVDLSLLSDDVLEDIYVRLCFMHPKNDTRKVEDAIYPIKSDVKVEISGRVRSEAVSILLKLHEDDDTKDRDLPSLVLEALQKCSGTMRKGLSHQILLVGGGALIPGLEKSLAAELNKRLEDNKTNPYFAFSDLQGLHNHFDFMSSAHVCVPSILVWLGGSIVGTLDQYGQKITKETYMRDSKMIPDWMNLKNLSLTL
eukprot:Phypoly_transcript_10905.p1 GENE.Phypoly_transcript_10905~~Phypoly_transcript_10905.p1  ORF type:complete len:381 (+),score=26.28 Phypoly_transcript_10905:44-1186(+)